MSIWIQMNSNAGGMIIPTHTMHLPRPSVPPIPILCLCGELLNTFSRAVIFDHHRNIFMHLCPPTV